MEVGATQGCLGDVGTLHVGQLAGHLMQARSNMACKRGWVGGGRQADSHLAEQAGICFLHAMHKGETAYPHPRNQELMRKNEIVIFDMDFENFVCL